MGEDSCEIIKNIASVSELIRDWQALIAILFTAFSAVFGYWIKRILQRRRDLRETKRVIEISLISVFNRMNFIIFDLEDFITRVRSVIKQIKQTPSNSKCLHTTNFPALSIIYFDQELINKRVDSYYLHNKLLRVFYFIIDFNSKIEGFKKDYEHLYQNAILLSEKLEVGDQRRAYVDSLKSFIAMIEKFINHSEDTGGKLIMQTRSYNLKLLKHHYLTVWRYERPFFQYFKTSEEYEKYKASKDTLDRIDKLIEEDVDMELLELRSKKNKYT